MGIRRTVSTKYDAQLSSCNSISSFFVVDNHFKNWEKAIVRQGPEHAKEGSGYLQYYVLGIEAVEGHALGTVDGMEPRSVGFKVPTLFTVSHTPHGLPDG